MKKETRERWILFVGILAMVTVTTYPLYHNILEKKIAEADRVAGLRIARIKLEKDKEITLIVAEKDKEIARIVSEKDKEIAGIVSEKDKEIAGVNEGLVFIFNKYVEEFKGLDFQNGATK